MAATLKFRNSQGELVDIPSIGAARFKNEFGAIFEKAALGGAVAITKHDSPKAVLISYEEFQALVRARSPGLDDLGSRFDALLEGMQAPKVKAGMAARSEERRVGNEGSTRRARDMRETTSEQE